MAEPYCPCGGRCHHDTAPCSLGCWAAQKPWRPEEAAIEAERRGSRLRQPVEGGEDGRHSDGVPPVALALAVAVAASSPQPAHHGPQRVVGTASWGWGWAGVVTRLPRGTRIRVCGPLACWSGRSVGYGPARWTHRVADLSRPVFARLCGDPRRGLCRVTLEVLPR